MSQQRVRAKFTSMKLDKDPLNSVGHSESSLTNTTLPQAVIVRFASILM